MNTFLLVSIILGFFIILIIIFIVNRTANDSSNPIDSITKNGILGFELEDSKQFVLSRFRHLNLSYEDASYGFIKKKQYYYSPQYIESGSNVGNRVMAAKMVYNHIEHIIVYFEENKLSRIEICFEDKGEGTKEFAEFLSIKLSAKFGKCSQEHVDEDKGIYTWLGEHIVLVYIKDDIDKNKTHFKLFIDGKRL
jgi:hypothetical protein